MLRQEQVESYHQQGYLGVEAVLTPAEVEALREVSDHFLELSRSVSEHDDVFDLEPGHSAETPRLRRLKNPIAQDPVYDQTMRHPKIIEIVSQLIGEGIRCNGNKLNMKSPGFGSAVEWHQDWAFYPHTNDDLLAVGVAMDDMTLENGCLLVIPGSHRGRIYEHHQDGRFAGAVTEYVPDADKAVPIEVPAGGISIHHVRTLHASAPNRSSKPRRLLLFQYCALDAWPLTGGIGWDSFQGEVVQGQASNRPRLEKVPVLLPEPAAERTGSIYETQSILKQAQMSRR
jgi:ectoine hydroxylase-related dioxygenase (phytanoyl-CoA dioxygenase family)